MENAIKPAASSTKKRLGEELVARGLVDEQELHRALLTQRAKDVPLGECLIEASAIAPSDLLEVLSEMLEVPSVDLGSTYSDPMILERIPKTAAYDLLAIPLFLVGNQMTVAIPDPQNLEKIDQLRFITGKEIMPVLALRNDISRHLKMFYGESGTALEGDTIHFEDFETDPKPNDLSLEDQEHDRPIVRLVNLVLIRAIQEEASDIHLEPGENSMTVRFRIDGKLHIKPFSIPASAVPSVVSRIKILSHCDISEKRTPQDGKMRINYQSRRIDVRVSTFPTIHGEKAVLRLLDKDRQKFNLNSIGMAESTVASWKRLLARKEGIILVTGPTGSGKSSTLFATLGLLAQPDVNITTLEDPVEYELAGISQGQVNDRAGFTFASGLRSILRQDPDIILVGEIRDLETAQIAVQAAMTGHLVLATLHTNDAPSAITRLIDMGLPRFMVGSAVVGVLAQRLVRRLCTKCAREIDATHEDQIAFSDWLNDDAPMLEGEGCDSCHGTGYHGRVGVHELLAIDNQTRRQILAGGQESEIAETAQKNGYRRLWFDGLDKVTQGTTNLRELARVITPVKAEDKH